MPCANKCFRFYTLLHRCSQSIRRVEPQAVSGWNSAITDCIIRNQPSLCGFRNFPSGSNSVMSSKNRRTFEMTVYVLRIRVVHALGPPVLTKSNRPEQVLHLSKKLPRHVRLGLEIDPHCVPALAAAQHGVVPLGGSNIKVIVRNAVVVAVVMEGPYHFLVFLKVEVEVGVDMGDTVVPFLTKHVVVLADTVPHSLELRVQDRVQNIIGHDEIARGAEV
mmetsp:Transcript_21764/g.60450  ORF Transcript_21764/g.60450 Transcript_21764/m.60450 type:complete len:219 (+) Transcript_21764:2446-3102(+)